MRPLFFWLLPILFSITVAFGQTMNLGAPGLRVGIGFPAGLSATPRYPLSFPNTLGDKISLWNTDPNTSTGAHYGLGVQSSRLQIFTPTSNDHIVFGTGNSANFTPTTRFLGDGRVGINTGTIAQQAVLDVANELDVPLLNFGFNTTTGTNAIGMGLFNTIGGANAIAIGSGNQVDGTGSIAIGKGNTLNAANSVALGSNMTSTITYDGAFLIGDNSAISSNTSSTAPNQFTARFANGYRFFTNAGATVGALLAANSNAWSTISDSSRKERFLPVNHTDLLAKIRSLRLGTWNYKGQRDQRHYGPMAQDFFARFGHDDLGQIGSDTLLNSHDFTAVTLSGVQALALENEALKARIARLEAEQKQTDARLKTLELMMLSRTKDRRTARR